MMFRALRYIVGLKFAFISCWTYDFMWRLGEFSVSNAYNTLSFIYLIPYFLKDK